MIDNSGTADRKVRSPAAQPILDDREFEFNISAKCGPRRLREVRVSAK